MGLLKKKINKKIKMGKEAKDSKDTQIRKKKNIRKKPEGLIGTSSVWRSSVDDPFSVLVGSTEGGFLSLEEIDEDSYNLGQKDSAQSEETGSSLKKRKRETEKFDDRSESLLSEKDDSMQGLASKPTKKKKKKKKKIKKKDTIESKNETVHLSEEDRDADNANAGISGVPDDISAKDCEGDLSFDEEEFSAWNELRLHPLLKRAIWALQFKEPTPIQKLCIPAAAHQGKDVIGAAETGSGKTLAFGLPILQRLLEEQEKAARKEGFAINGQTFTGEETEAPLRALIVTPTRELALQVCDHLRAAAKFTNIRVVPIVGGLAPQKQERLLKKRPQIIVGTPGRLWELMAGGERHLAELHSLSFFVLDEADRMIEKGHFHELQSIIDMLPEVSDHSIEPRSLDGAQPSGNASGDEVKQSFKKKKRQTFVFSATIALTSGFRKKLSKGGLHKIKLGTMDENDSLAALSERAGVRQNAAVVDLTSSSIMAHNLEESVIECREEDKDMYLYYILKVHGCGRTIVFCTSIAALRRLSALLQILKVTAWPLHAQMQQRARLKAMDRFKENDNCVLVATDVAARGLDIPGVRTVIHYQLPHSAEVYVHRSGRTARAATDGCSIALIAPTERSKYVALCRSFSKDGLQGFPVNSLYMPEVEKRLSIARQIDRILRKHSQSKAQHNWYIRNAEALEIDIENNERDKEEPRATKSSKAELFQAKQLQKELDHLLTCPIQPKSLSRRFVTGAGMSTLLQQQLQELTSNKAPSNYKMSNGSKKHRLLVIAKVPISNILYLGGPNIASEVYNKEYANARICGSEKWAKPLAKFLRQPHFMVWDNPDLVTHEVMGGLKNVYAIGAGMVAALTNESATSKAVYFAHSTSEMIYITHLLAEEPEKLAGPLLSDTYVTLLKGRNAWYGQRVAKGELRPDMGDSIEGKGTIQGVSAVEAFYELLRQPSLSVLHPEGKKEVAPIELCPILKTLYNILIKREATAEVILQALRDENMYDPRHRIEIVRVKNCSMLPLLGTPKVV